MGGDACSFSFLWMDAVALTDYSYENMKRIVFEGGATFVPVCEKCGRFVKADESVEVNEITGLRDQPNADCRKCGRTKMLFEGFY